MLLNLICLDCAQDSRVISVACGAEHTLAALDTGEVSLQCLSFLLYTASMPFITVSGNLLVPILVLMDVS